MEYSFLLNISQAQLAWDNRQLEFRPTINETPIIANFTFTNLGSYPVTINKITTSCGCTTAQLEKRVYLPGEGNVLQGVFNIGSRTGFQQKNILIETDDKNDPYIQLTIKAHLPEIIKITPQFVFWLVGETNASKTIQVESLEHIPIEILGVESTHEDIFAKLKTIEPNLKYEITVTPKNMNRPANASLRLDALVGTNKENRVFNAYAQIKPQTRVSDKGKGD